MKAKNGMARMAQLHFSDEVLMAFADGELDEQVAATVEQGMAADPLVAKRVGEFLRSRRLVRSVFPAQSSSDVPPELQAAVQAMIDRAEDQRAEPVSLARRRSRGPWVGYRPGIALAASVAVLVAAGAWFLAGPRGADPAALGPIASLAALEIGHVLADAPSGRDVALPAGTMRVISTFRVSDGTLCREFRLRSGDEGSHAVACRTDGWKITFALASEAQPNTYAPSDGTDLMATYLQNAEAGQPLLDGAELSALKETRAPK